jgi:hypothetical protein
MEEELKVSGWTPDDVDELSMCVDDQISIDVCEA